MAINYPAHRYQEVEIKTATPLELVVLLYDAGIASLQKAHECIAAHDIANRTRCLNKASSILTELQANLNFEAGGNVAESLDRLYRYMRDRIIQANMKQDAAAVMEVVSLLTGLRSAWAEIARTEVRKAAQPTPAASRSELPLVSGGSTASPLAGLNVTA
jgi:flagellar protein FliS